MWISIKRNFIFNLINYSLFFVNTTLFLLHIGSRGFIAVLFGAHVIFIILHLLETIKKNNSLFNFDILINIFFALCSLIICVFVSVGFPFLRGSLSSSLESQSILSFWKSCLNIADIFDELIPIYELKGLTISPLNLEFHISIGEAYGQMVNVIDLLESGYSRGLTTFSNLLPQSLPSFFDGVIYDRPISDSQYLLDFVQSSGGFLLHANLFWNNGYAGLIIGLLLLVISTYYIDNIFLKSQFFAISFLYISFAYFYCSIFLWFPRIGAMH